MLLFKSMTGSDLLTKLVLLAYLHFERSYSNTSQLYELLNLGLPKNKLEKALGYLVDEGYLVKTVTLQRDGRLKKGMTLPVAVTDECKFIWQRYADSSKWESALEQILKSASGCQEEQSAKTHSLTELDHFVMITCLVNADEFRYFTDSNAKCIAESIGINVTQFEQSFLKLIQINLIYQVTKELNNSVIFQNASTFYRIKMPSSRLNTVILVPEFEHWGFRKRPEFLRLLARYKTALDKYKRLQDSESNRAVKNPRPPPNLLAMGISDIEIQRLAALIPVGLFQTLREVFLDTILGAIRNYVNQSRRVLGKQSDNKHLFQSVNASVSALIGKVLSYEEPTICEVTECPEPTPSSTEEHQNCDVTECSESTSSSTEEPKTCEVTERSESTSLSAEERENFRNFIISWLIAEAVDVGMQLAKQCQVFAKANPSLDFSNCSFIETFGIIAFADTAEEDGEAQKTYSKTIDFFISGIVNRAQSESCPVNDSIVDNGVLYEIRKFQPRVSQTKGVKKAD